MTYISEETFEVVGYTIESVLTQSNVLTELLSSSPTFTFESPLFLISCLSGFITLIYFNKKFNKIKIRK